MKKEMVLINKIFWHVLNPKEKFQRFKHSLWLLIVLFVKFHFMIALSCSLILLIFAYFTYHQLQKEADTYIKSCHKSIVNASMTTLFKITLNHFIFKSLL